MKIRSIYEKKRLYVFSRFSSLNPLNWNYWEIVYTVNYRGKKNISKEVKYHAYCQPLINIDHSLKCWRFSIMKDVIIQERKPHKVLREVIL